MKISLGDIFERIINLSKRNIGLNNLLSSHIKNAEYSFLSFL